MLTNPSGGSTFYARTFDDPGNLCLSPITKTEAHAAYRAYMALMIVVATASLSCTPRVGDVKNESAFIDVTRSSFSPEPAINGWSGLAMFDYDNDGDIDIFVTTAAGAPHRLYQNDGTGQFVDVAEAAGVALDADLGVTVGVGDFDNDGWLDLLIGRQIPPGGGEDTATIRYLKNLGLGGSDAVIFEDRTEDAGLSGVAFASSFGVGDFDNDGLLDVYVGRYDFRGLTFALGSYHPDTPNALLRSTGIVDGVPLFEDVTDAANAAGIPVPGVAPSSVDIVNRIPTWSVYVSDVNGDGFQDIFIAHEIQGGVDLLLNDGDFTFTPTQTEAMSKHGGWMGITGGDFDRDGHVDYFVTNVGADAQGPELSANRLAGSWRPPDGSPFHLLLASDGAGGLLDVTGTTAVTPGALVPTNNEGGEGLAAYEFGFGCALIDANLDGWLDLTWTGDLNLSPDIPDGPLRIDFHGVARFLEGNGDGSFIDRTGQRGLFNMSNSVPLGYGYSRPGRALGAIDLTGDGFPDIIRTDRVDNDGFRCLINPGAEDGRWLMVRAEGTASNRFGIGARVEISAGRDTFVSEIITTTSAFTAVHPQAHFGLGTHDTIDVLTVRWPSGAETTMTNVPTNTIVLVQE